MQDVKIGDRVQVMDANGELTYDDVYFFGHRSTEAVGSFVRLTLGSRYACLALLACFQPAYLLEAVD